jgi:hypothetical protein
VAAASAMMRAATKPMRRINFRRDGSRLRRLCPERLGDRTFLLSLVVTVCVMQVTP